MYYQDLRLNIQVNINIISERYIFGIIYSTFLPGFAIADRFGSYNSLWMTTWEGCEPAELALPEKKTVRTYC